ncbi:hypothetical protein [Nitratidesulfovibrio termitidis]|uniref:hypothetical protein n=1 Tax=Nitratidesulfovibrio termitidis TaxID=42252 RepID=UPI00041298CC|nr:hypothetical protein [Nitratidesulfovibrio termitidis]
MDSRQYPHGDRNGTVSAVATSRQQVSDPRGGLPEGSGGPADAVGGAGSPASAAQGQQGQQGQQGREGESLVSGTGYVLPDAWGKNFEVAGVLIADDRERELVVGNVAEHPDLLGLCRRKVTATGWLAARDGRLLFTVRDFMVVDGAG